MVILGIEAQALLMPGQGNAGPRVTAVRSTACRSITGGPRGTRSIAGRSTAACFSVTRLRSGPRLSAKCAPDTPPPPPEEPLPKRPGKMYEFVRKALSELKTNAFAWLLLISCTLVGFMAVKDNATAVYLVNICEKSEKVHKFLSHFVLLLTAIAKCFK